MKVVAYDPRQGCAIQGAVILLPLPKGIVIDRSSPVVASTQSVRYEMTMRPHSRPQGCFYGDLEILTEGERHVLHSAYSLGADGSLSIYSLTPTQAGTGTLFDDEKGYEALVACGILTEEYDGAGLLLIEHCPLPLVQEGRAAILIPPGSYYVGRRRRWGYFHEPYQGSWR